MNRLLKFIGKSVTFKILEETIVPNEIVDIYPVDLETRLRHAVFYKSR